MHFKTAIGQTAVVDGQRYDQAHGVLAEEPVSRFSRHRSRGNLYVLVEITGPVRSTELIADKLAETIRDTYYSQRGSITAALRQAIQEANRLLHEENRRSMPDRQRIGGVSCAVLRNTDLFVGQAGPAALFVRHNDGVVRFPDSSPWLNGAPPAESEAAPLGRRSDIHVDLFHTQVSKDNLLVLVDSNLARSLPAEVAPHILSGSSIAAILSRLAAMDDGQTVLALAVSLGHADTVRPRDRQRPVPTPVPVRRPAPPSAAAVTPKPVATKGERIRLGERLRSVGIWLAAFFAGLLAFLKRLVPTQTKTRAAPGVARPAATEPMKRPRRRQRDAPRTRYGGLQTSALAQKLLIGIAIAIPLLVAIVVIWTVMQRSEAQQARMQELWLDAQSLWIQAQSTEDPAQIRALLTEANGYVDQLLEEQPDRTDALNLRTQIQARLEESSQVRRVHWQGELMTYPPDAKLSRVVVDGLHLFVLDRNANLVYHHQLDEFQQALKSETAETVLLRKGDQVGGVLVGDLVDMVWMPAGNGRLREGLVILESGGSLIDYDPSSGALVPLQLAGTDAWRFPQLVGSHSGRFYLLDSTANQIWRYSPTQDGYSAPPAQWLEAEIDLAGVRDMAVGDSIFLLYADGRIEKLSTGAPDQFDISDWDTPPRGPTAIFTRPPSDTQWVYVADPGNNRIVQSSKEGSFRRQFRLAESEDAMDTNVLGNVTSLFVDEIGGRAYFLSDDGLYMILLPPD